MTRPSLNRSRVASLPLLGVLFVLGFSGCAYTGSKTAIVACQAFDTWTTLRGLDLGATETGFIGDTPGQVIATKTVMTGVFVYARHKNIIDDKAATAINVITCAAAVHNLSVIRKQKELNERSSGGSAPIISFGIKF